MCDPMYLIAGPHSVSIFGTLQLSCNGIASTLSVALFLLCYNLIWFCSRIAELLNCWDIVLGNSSFLFGVGTMKGCAFAAFPFISLCGNILLIFFYLFI